MDSLSANQRSMPLKLTFVLRRSITNDLISKPSFSNCFDGMESILSKRMCFAEVTLRPPYRAEVYWVNYRWLKPPATIGALRARGRST